MLGENQRKLEIAQYVQYRNFLVNKYTTLPENNANVYNKSTDQPAQPRSLINVFVHRVKRCIGKQKCYAIKKSPYGSNRSIDQTVQSVILSIGVKRFMSVLKL